MPRSETPPLRNGAFFRNSTSPFQWGRRRDGTPIHAYTTQTLVDQMRRHEAIRESGQSARLGLVPLNKKQLRDHFFFKADYYFCGRHSGFRKNRAGSYCVDTKAFSLGMIDIDVHDNIGDIQTALAYAAWLIDRFPKLEKAFWEKSRRGVHGYIGISCCGLRDYEIAPLYDLLHLALRSSRDHYLRIFSDNPVSGVEFKGRPGVARYDRGRIVDYHRGTLALIPRGIESGISIPIGSYPGGHSFEDLTILSQDDIWSIHQLFPILEKSDTWGSLKSGRTLTDEQAESISGIIVPEGDSVFSYIALSRKLMSEALEDDRGRKATDWHLATFLLLLWNFHKKPNPNHELPRSRFEGAWRKLHECDRVPLPWSKDAYYILKDFLRDRGFLCEISNDWVYHEDPSLKGRSKRWTISASLAQLLREIQEQREEEKELSSVQIR